MADLYSAVNRGTTKTVMPHNLANSSQW